MGRKGKLEKFEGDHAPGKTPVEVIEGVGDSVALEIEDNVSTLLNAADELLALLKLSPEISPADAQELRTLVTESLLYLDPKLNQEILTFPATLRSAESARKDLRSARRRAEGVALRPTPSATKRAATALRQAEYRDKVYRAKEEVAAGRASLKAGRVVQADIHFHRALNLGAHEFAFSTMRSQKRTGSRSRAESAPAKALEPSKAMIRKEWARKRAAIETEFKNSGRDPGQHRAAVDQKAFEHMWELVRSGRIKIPVKSKGSEIETRQVLRRQLRRIVIDLGLIQKNPKRGRPRHSPLRPKKPN